MKKLLFLLLLIPSICFADTIEVDNPPLNVATVNGSVSSYPYKLVFPNGSLTDYNTGTVVTFNGTGGTGTVTDVSVVSANGLAGTVANSTTTPAITLSTTVNGIVKGNGTALSAATADVDYLTPSTASSTYVPYSGATSNVDLNTKSIATSTLFTNNINVNTSSVLSLNATTVTSPNLQLNGTLGNGYVDFLSQSTNPSSPSAGTIRLHSATANGFTRLEQDNEATTNTVYGRDEVIVCKNDSGGTINKGQVVYVKGTASGVPTVALARANSSTTMPALGFMMDTTADGAFNQVMKIGILNNVNTSVFSEGVPLYVSTTTAGSWQTTRPSGTAVYVQRLGSILSQNATTGSILVTTSPFVGNMETGTVSNWTGAGTVTGTQLISNIATGTAPLSVTSTTPVTNLSIGGNSGTATALQTARSIYGNNFDGTASLTQVIASTYGGTGNGFTKFSGPTTSEKTFTLPDSSSTIVVQGGALGTPSSGTLTNCTFPTLNQNTTGTASNVTGTVAVTNGGTGLTTVNTGSVLAFNSLNTASAITSTTGTKVLQNASGTISWATSTASTNFEVISFTRNLAAGDGSVNYSCTKGTPKAFVIFAALSGYGTSQGVDDVTTHLSTYNNSTTQGTAVDASITLTDTGNSNVEKGYVSAVTNNQFTITWTAVAGSPTGTAYVSVLVLY